jgi:hypothetical protein
MVKPTNLAEWGTGSAPITEPLLAEKQAGWPVAFKPPAQWFNWWMKQVHLWIVWLDLFETTAHTWTELQTFTAGITVTAGPGDAAITAAVTTTGPAAAAFRGSATLLGAYAFSGVNSAANGTAATFTHGGSGAGCGVEGVTSGGVGSRGVDGINHGSGSGVRGVAYDVSQYGVEGINADPDGSGVKGSSSGDGYGVYGESVTGRGVRGKATGAGGIGVEGEGGPGGAGVSGIGGVGASGVVGQGGAGLYGGDFYGGSAGPGLRASRTDGLTAQPAAVIAGTINIAGATDPAVTAPLLNIIAPRHIAKLWAYFTSPSGGGAVTPHDGLNVASINVHATNGEVTVTFAQQMASVIYAVIANQELGGPTAICQVFSKSTTSFSFRVYASHTATQLSTSAMASMRFSVIVFGGQ